MTRRRRHRAFAALALCASVLFVVTQLPAKSANRNASPAAINRPGANIADAYLFPSPSNPQNVVVAMTVHPGIPAGQGSSTFFDNSVLYQMKFDTQVGGEAVGATPLENLVIQFSMTAAVNNTQVITVYGPAAPVRTGTNTAVLSTNVGTGNFNQVFQTANGMTVFAGVRADPFFFDYNQFYKIFPNRNQGSSAQSCLKSGSGTCPQGFNNPGMNSQASQDVLAIVVELPRSMLEPNGSGPKVAYWATTSTSSGN